MDEANSRIRRSFCRRNGGTQLAAIITVQSAPVKMTFPPHRCLVVGISTQPCMHMHEERYIHARSGSGRHSSTNFSMA